MSVKTILVIDDNDGDQFLMSHNIEEFDESIHVECAFDGKEALQKITDMSPKPDLIILDINMPGMDGFEFLDHYTKHPHNNASVVMMSSSEAQQDKERSLQFDCVKAYYTKPISAEDISVIVKL
ncbi:MAG: response regulator [Rickettsiales bacterium]|nr:response regulator [Rickettsiales bacterium]